MERESNARVAHSVHRYVTMNTHYHRGPRNGRATGRSWPWAPHWQSNSINMSALVSGTVPAQDTYSCQQCHDGICITRESREEGGHHGHDECSGERLHLVPFGSVNDGRKRCDSACTLWMRLSIAAQA